jgi:ParB family chromosome partitioning protein
MGHARALLGLPSEEQPAAALEVLDRKLNVRATEQMVQRRISEVQPSVPDSKDKATTLGLGKPKNSDGDIRHLEQELSDHLGAAVSIKTKSKGGGDMVLRFHDLDQLDGLIAILKR